MKKKIDGRSKAARAAKVKANQLVAPEVDASPEENVTVGGASVLGRRYAPLHMGPVPALNVQIGGSHYRTMEIQPMEYSMKNKLDPCQHTIVKYVSRFRDKGGIEDLEKAKHVIDMLIEFERGA